MFYAEILIHEFREPDRYQVIGPFSGEKDEIVENLAFRGDHVVAIGTADEMGVVAECSAL